MNNLKGLIFDIQAFSVHDGPGSRTLVFLSGCPLRCDWCANPEGMEFRQRIMYSGQKCKNLKTGCIRCIKACPHNAITISDDTDTPLVFDYSICKDCKTHDCTKVCYHEAVRLSGKWMTITELMKVVKRDSRYWQNGGGVTFSGGEAFIQNDFLLAALKKCKESSIHTAIETTANVPTNTFLNTMKLIDFAFIDVKHMDPDKHKEKTGVSNELILNNIKALAKSDWKGRLILRMPVIRDYNDNDDNIQKIVDFMNSVGLFEFNILPFHRLGTSKWTQLGMTYKYSEELPTSEEKLEHIQDIFINQGIACYVGHEVIY